MTESTSGTTTRRRTISQLSEVPDLPASVSGAIPSCHHGRASRFTRTDTKNSISRDFYACSANRDRRICPLFHWVDEWERKINRRTGLAQGAVYQQVSIRPKKSRPDDQLGIEAYTDNRANAQFLFDEDSISIITHIVGSATGPSGVDGNVLCVGTPSIHKALLVRGIPSVLLDEDERLPDVIPRTQRFNVFNGELYGLSVPLDEFRAVVIDPPFQPELLPALFGTLRSLFPKSMENLVLFAFPYFNEAAVTKATPNLCMTDIRLKYRNHKKYVTGERSPVRLYSSDRLKVFLADFRTDEYKLCVRCDDYKHRSNHHCDKCHSCTTVSGKHRFKHCDLCGKCVKADASHCLRCSRCFITNHACS